MIIDDRMVRPTTDDAEFRNELVGELGESAALEQAEARRRADRSQAYLTLARHVACETTPTDVVEAVAVALGWRFADEGEAAPPDDGKSRAPPDIFSGATRQVARGDEPEGAAA